jgi:hypothetical protein
MNKVEVAKLMTRASAMDNRIVTEEKVEAWFEVLHSVPYEFAVQAVNNHFKESTDYLLPAHIVAGARHARDRRERDQRLRAALDPGSQRNLQLEASEADRQNAIPQCEHGMSLVRCMPCCIKEYESSEKI